MAHQFPPKLETLIREQMQQGSYSSEDELLLDALHALALRRRDYEAIRAGIEDITAGRTRPLDDVVNEICEKHGLSADDVLQD